MSTEALSSSLHSLLPTLVGPLPPDLLNLSTSLLAQSRSRIGTLKPAEEIARSFACAHLACERLKNAFDLPPFNPRPPLPKKQYENLLNHFRTSLPATIPATARTATAARRKAEPEEPSVEVDEECEERIRKMCSELRVVPEAATCIIRGMKTAPHNPEQRDSLVAALSVVVFERLSADFAVGNICGLKWVRGDASTFQEKKSIMIDLVGGKATERGVTEWMKKWHRDKPPYHLALLDSIPNGMGLFSVMDDNEPFWRRDRMLHGGVDYLAEARVKSFEAWKRNMLWCCDEIDTA